MKKTITLILSLILLLSNIGLPVSIANEDLDKPWGITSYIAIADVNPDGSIVVEEYISYKFVKDFTGALQRSIDTTNASGVDQMSIYRAVDINEEDITKSKLEAIEGDSYDVLLDEEYGMVEGVDISLGVEDKQTTLVFKYKLNDLVGVYRDMALLDWSFIKEGDNDFIDHVSIDVNIPKVKDIESIESFIQGPLYSQQTKEGRTIHFEGNIMSLDRDLKTFLLLPTSLVPDGRKRIDNDITGDILGAMDNYEKEMEEVRKDYETRKLLIKLLTYLTLGGIIIAMAYLYVKYHRDPKVTKEESHIDKLPADYYTPAELGVFMNRGKVRLDYTIATLIDLVNRGYLNISSIKGHGFNLSRNPDVSTDQLKAHEGYLLGWLFDDVGQGAPEVSTDQFQSWIKDGDNRKRYENKYETWSKLVVKQASKWKFFQDVKKAKVIGSLLGLVGIIPGSIIWSLGDQVQGSIVIGLSIVLLIYSQLIRKRTEFGAINNAQWLSFKRNIKNASHGKLKKPEVDQWDKFIPYAISIKGAHDMIIEFKKIYGDKGLKDKDLFFLHSENLERTEAWIESME